MSDFVDYYELLNIQPGATTREITLAYKSMAKKLHPDKNPNDPKAGEKFDQIAQAYRILIDPSLRSEVDQKMKVTLARKEEDRKRTDEQKKMKDDLSRKEAEGIMIYFFEIYLAFQQKKSYFTPKEIQQLKIQRIREANARIAASLFEEKKVNKKTTENVAKTDEKEIYMSDDEFLAYEKKILDNLKNHINNN